ncbi:MAG: hypothetical protein PHG44_05775 [Lentisphaeria bacterium]|jgi:hypothetical protein|nr:hypothetical protein [Lentisphaeria bacterium]MDY0175281.1 hypothetical protein [Lentisphaeria bacterium]NLZ60957.1 hypothetical protein [Lentisphaerota bacterium]
MLKNFLCVFFVLFGLACGAQVFEQHWVETFAWQGFGTGYTDKFEVFGARWRVRYRTLNPGPLSVTLFDSKEAQVLPLVSRPVKRRTMGYEQFKHSFGEKFLFVEGSMGGWRVSVEEYVDSVEEWKHKRWVNDQPDLERKAVWAGAGEREFTYEADGAWKLEYEQKSDGLMQIQAFNQAGELVFDSFGSKNGLQSGGCIHTAGSYTVKITTSDVAWCVYALQTLDKKSH